MDHYLLSWNEILLMETLETVENNYSLKPHEIKRYGLAKKKEKNPCKV